MSDVHPVIILFRDLLISIIPTRICTYVSLHVYRMDHLVLMLFSRVVVNDFKSDYSIKGQGFEKRRETLLY